MSVVDTPAAIACHRCYIVACASAAALALAGDVVSARRIAMAYSVASFADFAVYWGTWSPHMLGAQAVHHTFRVAYVHYAPVPGPGGLGTVAAATFLSNTVLFSAHHGKVAPRITGSQKGKQLRAALFYASIAARMRLSSLHGWWWALAFDTAYLAHNVSQNRVRRVHILSRGSTSNGRRARNDQVDTH